MIWKGKWQEIWYQLHDNQPQCRIMIVIQHWEREDFIYSQLATNRLISDVLEELCMNELSNPKDGE